MAVFVQDIYVEGPFVSQPWVCRPWLLEPTFSLRRHKGHGCFLFKTTFPFQGHSLKNEIHHTREVKTYNSWYQVWHRFEPCHWKNAKNWQKLNWLALSSITITLIWRRDINGLRFPEAFVAGKSRNKLEMHRCNCCIRFIRYVRCIQCIRFIRCIVHIENIRPLIWLN